MADLTQLKRMKPSNSVHVPCSAGKAAAWLRGRRQGFHAAADTAMPETVRSILIRCREFIDTTKVPAYPAGADLADEIDALLAAPEQQ